MGGTGGTLYTPMYTTLTCPTLLTVVVGAMAYTGHHTPGATGGAPPYTPSMGGRLKTFPRITLVYSITFSN